MMFKANEKIELHDFQKIPYVMCESFGSTNVESLTNLYLRSQLHQWNWKP